MALIRRRDGRSSISSAATGMESRGASGPTARGLSASIRTPAPRRDRRTIPAGARRGRFNSPLPATQPASASSAAAGAQEAALDNWRVRLYLTRLWKRLGAGVLRGLQIRWEPGEPGSGGFDSHTLPPSPPHPHSLEEGP